MSNPPPDPADLRFALDQFGADADRWRECSTSLHQAASAAEDLALQAHDFGLAFFVHGSYLDLQGLITTLLRDGGSVCSTVADQLIASRDTYRREEDENVHLMKGIW